MELLLTLLFVVAAEHSLLCQDCLSSCELPITLFLPFLLLLTMSSFHHTLFLRSYRGVTVALLVTPSPKFTRIPLCVDVPVSSPYRVCASVCACVCVRTWVHACFVKLPHSASEMEGKKEGENEKKEREKSPIHSTLRAQGKPQAV